MSCFSPLICSSFKVFVFSNISFTVKNFNIENFKRNLKNYSSYLKPKRQNSRVLSSELSKYFSQTGKRLTTTKPHRNDELKYLIRSFPDKNNGFQLQTVSYEDLEQCFRLLRNDCSTWYDNIPAMFIKPVAELLVSPLTFVINNYIATNNFPYAWKTARISPIPKKTQPVELKDYIPVSILLVLSKVYEKLVLQQPAVFRETESVYHQYQSGYR